MNVIAKISCYLERSVVTLKLRKEYLNTVTHNTSILLRIKNWTVWYIERYSMSTYTGVIQTVKKQSGFLAHPVLWWWKQLVICVSYCTSVVVLQVFHIDSNEHRLLVKELKQCKVCHSFCVQLCYFIRNFVFEFCQFVFLCVILLFIVVSIFCESLSGHWIYASAAKIAAEEKVVQ